MTTDELLHENLERQRIALSVLDDDGSVTPANLRRWRAYLIRELSLPVVVTWSAHTEFTDAMYPGLWPLPGRYDEKGNRLDDSDPRRSEFFDMICIDEPEDGADCLWALLQVRGHEETHRVGMCHLVICDPRLGSASSPETLAFSAYLNWANGSHELDAKFLARENEKRQLGFDFGQDGDSTP